MVNSDKPSILISIIIPNYNGGKTIISTIKSVINQSYELWELLIIDDCSNDNSITIINELCRLDSRISFFPLHENSGTPAVPRNKGLDVATGDYIAFLDADDIWHPQKLEIQLNFMIKNKSSFSFTNVFPFKNDGEINGQLENDLLYNNNIQNQKVNYSILIRKNFVKSCSTALVTKKLIGSKRFNNDPIYKAVEDYLFWLDLLDTNCKYAHWLNLFTTFYRESDSSISKSKIFMIKQNYKLYNFLFHNQRNKWLKIGNHMFTYGYYSSKNIIDNKITRKKKL